MAPLPLHFFDSDNVVQLAKSLIGVYLHSYVDGQLTVGRIVETEAYCGQDDKACHAYNNRITNRTKVMFGPSGVAYVYLCYGIHHLFNIVTNKAGFADAILIRALEPVDGQHIMAIRRKQPAHSLKLTAGPGALSQAMGITTRLNGIALDGGTLWLEQPTVQLPTTITSTTRIGVSYAGEDALLPWRFYDANSPYVSKR